MRRIIISDIHIGSKYYKGEALVSFLKEEKYDQLILNGDILDLIKIPAFTSRALEIFKCIDYTKEIIYVVGNHDIPFRGLIGHEFFGIKFVDKYEFEDAGRKFRIEHGDQYDESWVVHKQLLIKLISIFHAFFEDWLNIDLTTWWVNRLIKKRKLIRIWDILTWNNDADVIIVGHSHVPEAVVWVDEDQKVKTYINCGEWLGKQTFVCIEDGIARLKKYKEI